MAKMGKYVYQWPRPMVTVDMVVFAVVDGTAKMLLIKRGGEPYKGTWAFPGGFMEMDEELEDAAVRELAEETSLRNVNLEQMHTFGTIGRDPRGRQITIVFMGITAPENMNIAAGDDAAEAKWFKIDKLPEMAFDHDRIAKMAIEKMNKNTKANKTEKLKISCSYNIYSSKSYPISAACFLKRSMKMEKCFSG